jgi:hypothetical protein
MYVLSPVDKPLESCRTPMRTSTLANYLLIQDIASGSPFDEKQIEVVINHNVKGPANFSGLSKHVTTYCE